MRRETFIHHLIAKRILWTRVEITSGRGQSIALLGNLIVFLILKPPLRRIIHFLPVY